MHTDQEKKQTTNHTMPHLHHMVFHILIYQMRKWPTFYIDHMHELSKMEEFYPKPLLAIF